MLRSSAACKSSDNQSPFSRALWRNAVNCLPFPGRLNFSFAKVGNEKRSQAVLGWGLPCEVELDRGHRPVTRRATI